MLGRRSQRDFEDEIRSHIDLEVERLRAQGLSPQDAEREARRRFGNVGVVEDRFYHAQRFASVEDLGRDIQHAWRALRRTPGFLVTAVVTLGLAIGAVTGMFNVVNSVILKPLAFPDADRLVVISGTAPGSDLPERFAVGTEFYLHYKERSKLLDGVFVFASGMSTFRTPNRAERIPLAWPSNDMYATLGVRPQLGRLPVAEDNDDVIVISDRFWSSWFGRDPSVIGKSYFVDDSLKQIIGVMPPEFGFPDDEILLWISTPILPQDVRPGQGGGWPMVARLKDGVTHDQLAAELTRLSKELPARFGGPPAYARNIALHRALVNPTLAAMLGPVASKSLWVLLGAVAVVLLIACANVANLFLVRAESRTRDLAIRRAIGASRAQLVRLQMSEALLVALVAGVLAVTLSRVALPVFIKAAPKIPRLAGVSLDLPTLAAAFGLVLLTALACGVVPAMRASSPNLTRLREGGRGSTRGANRGRNVLVIAQTALALVLLIGAALLVQSFNQLRNVNPGYDTNDIYTFQFAPDRQGLDGPGWGRLHLDFMDRLRALPGVTGVGVVNNIPLDEGTNEIRVRTSDTPTDGSGTAVNLNAAGGDYFNVMGIKLLQGRVFTTAEAAAPNNSVIISRSTAEKLWPGQNPLGRALKPRISGQEHVVTVVGVVEDVKQEDWREQGQANLYIPLSGPTPGAWRVGTPAYVVKSVRAEQLTSEVRELVRQVAPEAPVYREHTMEFLARRSMLHLSFTMLTLGVVAGLALLLGAIGLYGVLSYVVAQRTREIGLRMALGATASGVRRMVVSQGVRVVVVGVVIGVVVARGATRLLRTLLYGVEPVDPIVFGAMSVMMIAIGALASFMPARRASSVSPIESLRSD